eukprot:s70_g12.t1
MRAFVHGLVVVTVCRGGFGTSRMQRLWTKVCRGTPQLWTFRDPGDVMTCRNYQACYNSVEIEGMGAVCCENVDDDGQTCNSVADFELAGKDRREAADTVCSGDVCCMGYQTCYSGEARNVSSISCKGRFGFVLGMH